jgi:hypothetical protein
MERLPHYIWRTDVIDQARHFSECKVALEPFISLSMEEPDYVTITFDALPMYEMVLAKEDLLNWDSFDLVYERTLDRAKDIMKPLGFFYRSYCELFSLPEDMILVCGAEGAFAFRVREQHAGFMAEFLYLYLIKSKGDWLAREKRSQMRTPAY